MAVKVGELFAELKLDRSHFNAGINGAQGMFKELAKVAAVAAAAVVAALVAVGAASVRAAMKYQEAMELIQTQAGASTAEVKTMSAEILKMASSVGTAPEELAKGLYHIESAGLRGAEALDVLKMAALGAKVGQADLEGVVNALVAEVRSGIGGVNNMSEAMGVLNSIVGNGNMRMQDLTDAMGSGILSVAKTLGVTVQSVGAAIATMTDQGIPAVEAATKIKMAMVLMASPTGKAVKELAKLGLGQKDLAEAMRGPGGLGAALTLLNDRMDKAGLTATEKAQVIARAFGGGKTGPGIMLLVNSLDRLHEKEVSIGEGATNFGEKVAEMQQEVAFKADQVKASFDAISIQLGNVLLPVANMVFTSIASLLNSEGFQAGLKQFGAMLSWIATNVIPMVVTAFSSLVNTVGPVLIAAINAVSSAMPAITSAAAQLGSAVAGVASGVRSFLSDGSNLRGVLVAIGVVVMSIVVPAFVAWAAATIAATWPFVALGVAAFAVYKVLEHFGLIGPIIKIVGNVIGGVLGWLSKTVLPAFQAVFGGVFDFIKWITGSVAKVVGQHGDEIAAVAGVITGAFGGLATFMANVWRGIGNAIRSGINFVIDMVNGLIDAINGIQIHMDLGPAGKIDFNGMNLGKVGRLAMDNGPGASYAMPLSMGSKPVGGTPSEGDLQAEKAARRKANAGGEATGSGKAPAVDYTNANGPTGPGAAKSGAAKVAQAVKDAMQAAKDATSRAYDQMKDKAHAYFDAVHKATLKSIADARDAANAVLDAKEKELTGSLSAARQAVKDERDARQLAQLQQAVADAQTDEERAAAQQALTDFQKDQELERLQTSVDAQVAAIEAEKKANDDKAAAAAAQEDERYKGQVKSFDDQFELLKSNLEKGRITYKDANDKLLKLLGGYGVDYASAGEVLGKKFADGLESQVKAVEAAAKKYAAALKKAGIKNTLSMSDLSGTGPDLGAGKKPEGGDTGGVAAALTSVIGAIAPLLTAAAQPPAAGAQVTGGAAGSVTIGTINMPVQTSQDPTQFVKDSLQVLKREIGRQGMTLAN